MDSHRQMFLKISQWNARSIRNHIHELYEFMNENFVDIICLCETFLINSDILPTHPDFICYRLDRLINDENVRSGGVAIILRRKIKHKLMPFIDTKLLEVIGIEILLENNSSIQIMSAYLPGGASSINIRQHYMNDIRLLTNRNTSYFLMGDFNSRHRLWNCTRSNSAGNILFNALQRYNFIIHHPDQPTYFPPQNNSTPSFLDLVITNGLHQLNDSQTHSSSSDHEIITHKVTLNENHQVHNNRLIPLFKNANWLLYQRLVTSSIAEPELLTLEQIQSTDQIDEMISRLTNIMTSAQQRSVPLVSSTPYALTITPEIKQKIQLRNTIKRQAQRNPHLQATYRTQINQLNEEIHHDIQAIANENFNHFLSSIPAHQQTSSSLWKTSKFLKNRNNFMPPLRTDSQTFITPQEKSNVLAEQFSTNHQNPLETNNVSFTRYVNNTVNRFMQHSQNQIPSTDLTDVNEVSECIKRLKNSKAPGLDKIHNNLIKKLPPIGIVFLVLIINSCFKLTYFPQHWKLAKVISIRKPNKPAHSPASYRPISLLSSLSKIFERVLMNRLNNHLIDQDIIPPQQHGFRSYYSTSTQLHRLTSHIKNGLQNKLSTGLVCIDIEKAFDRVWHQGLIYKLIKINTPQYIIRIVYSFLKERTFQVAVNSTLSNIKSVPFGVPQGSVLSPTLYNIFTHDIPTLTDCEIALFADDTAFYTTSRFAKQIIKRLEKALKVFNKYLKRWKIKMNTEKTQAIFFSNRRTRQLPGNRKIRIDSTEVEWSTEIKYLGLKLDKKLKFKSHIQYILEKSHRAVRILYSMLNRRSFLSVDNKLLMYKVAIRPIIVYASPIFGNAAKTHIKKLQTFQNKTLKMILNVDWYTRTTDIHENSKMEYITTFMENLILKFNNKLAALNDNNQQ